MLLELIQTRSVGWFSLQEPFRYRLDNHGECLYCVALFMCVLWFGSCIITRIQMRGDVLVTRAQRLVVCVCVTKDERVWELAVNVLTQTLGRSVLKLHRVFFDRFPRGH